MVAEGRLQGCMHYHAPGMAIDPRHLLATLSDRHAVSGSDLAGQLGVTRAAVWKQIEALRDLGAPIEAEAGTGYRLAWPFEPLDARSILNALDLPTRAALAGIDVHWQIDSTNAELLRVAGKAQTAARVCLAETQSAGRGRRGRTWQSPLGGNLYFSLLWPFEQGMGGLSGLSLVAGIAAVEALKDCGVEEIGLKWPNDVIARGSKLAGILVELGGEFLGPCHAVIGIGINLRLPTAARSAIDQPAIDVAALTGDAVPSRNRLAASLTVRLVAALERFRGEGFAPFRDDYAHNDLLHGRPIQVLTAGKKRDGVAAGIDERGALIVRCGKALIHLDSAEVSVRSTAHGTATPQ